MTDIDHDAEERHALLAIELPATDSERRLASAYLDLRAKIADTTSDRITDMANRTKLDQEIKQLSDEVIRHCKTIDEMNARLAWLEKLFERKYNGVLGEGSQYTWVVHMAYRHQVALMVGASFGEAIDAAIKAEGPNHD
jgi:hypothetical protein